MSRNPILNAELNAALSKVGAGDRVALIAARFPAPEGVEVIDLALCDGVPSFKTAFELLVMQLDVDQVTRTEELEKQSPELQKLIEAQTEAVGAKLEALTYRQFKVLAKTARFAVRVGETEVQASVIIREREV
ncbi:RbsD/FucU domain-containing protein [Acidaminobacter hydrogenoformans]|uniref:D-ribose pyranase n=1 Tax=Acidaminobacter hydrogenoformans DSM 2784 TaxID=1120920 RepID=A0A1G5S566_9FIRM|nr:RbsD/FucU domain-containing protein [Acidaminobacter hydrogenoformans]SCZ81495.1 D-ribose pyranase [Acidaminobacter hydrogenoformans DSM 2784]